MDKYFKSRSLDPIEGVWSFTANGHYGEVAIIKNPSNEFSGWDYVGVLVNADNSFGKVGNAKIILRKTAEKSVFTGVYFRSREVWGVKSHEATNFVLSDRHILQTGIPYLGIISFVRLNIGNTGSGGTGGGKLGSGTGFFVTPTIVITNEHVIAKAKRVEVTFQHEYTFPAKVLAKDEGNDVAILLVEGLESRVKPFPLGRTNSVKEGERIYTVGFPLADALSSRHKISEGIVNGLTGFNDDPKEFQVSLPIQPGNSGGPLITSDGRVIGITSSGLNSKSGPVPQNVNFAVKSDYIMPLLDVIGIKVERLERQERVLDPVAIMDMAKDAVVFVESYGE